MENLGNRAKHSLLEAAKQRSHGLLSLLFLLLPGRGHLRNTYNF